MNLARDTKNISGLKCSPRSPTGEVALYSCNDLFSVSRKKIHKNYLLLDAKYVDFCVLFSMISIKNMSFFDKWIHLTLYDELIHIYFVYMNSMFSRGIRQLNLNAKCMQGFLIQ